MISLVSITTPAPPFTFMVAPATSGVIVDKCNFAHQLVDAGAFSRVVVDSINSARRIVDVIDAPDR